jgi:hypothetical protein
MTTVLSARAAGLACVADLKAALGRAGEPSM